MGTARFTFSDDNNATFDYTEKSNSSAKTLATQSKRITRQLFASPVPTCLWGTQPPLTDLPTNYQDLGVKSPAGSESGWAISLTHRGDTIFAIWYTYDANGKPWWLAFVANRWTSVAYKGMRFATSGPPFNAEPLDPANVIETTVRTATLYFTGAGAYFEYTVNGVPQTKPITRQVVAPPGGACL